VILISSWVWCDDDCGRCPDGDFGLVLCEKVHACHGFVECVIERVLNLGHVVKCLPRKGDRLKRNEHLMIGIA
jgi:hypothetical protein